MQVNVFRHDNVSSQGKPIAVADFIKDLYKEIPGFNGPKQWESAIATACDEVQVTLSISALQSFRHLRPNQDPPLQKAQGRGTQN